MYQRSMTDNGPSPEYLFIYPWTVTAAVVAVTHLSCLSQLPLPLLLSVRVEMRMKGGEWENEDEAP